MYPDISPRSVAAKPPHYLGLDLLRIIAAYLVVFNHFGQFNTVYVPEAHGPIVGAPLAFPLLQAFSGVGSVGVEIFFVISGFVIAGSVQGVEPVQFVTRRIVRLAPALWICSSITLIARALSGEHLPYLLVCWGKSVILSPIGPYIDGVAWTLVVEAFFYMTVFLSMLSLRGRSLDRLRTIIGSASVIYLVVFSAARIAETDPTAAQVVTLLDRFFFKFFMLQHGVFFALGMAFWRWNHSGRPTARLPTIILLAVFGCVEIVAVSRNSAIATAATLAIWLSAMVWLVGSVCFHVRLSAVLSSQRRLIGSLGRLSYTVYLTHYAFGMVCSSVLLAAGIPPLPSFVLALIIVSLVSWLVMAGPERHLQSTLRPRLETLANLIGGWFRFGAAQKV